MKTRLRMLPLGSVVALAATAAFALAPAPFTLDWFTVDGGGAMRSTGGGFELSGTIGQSDATAPLAGEGFQLTGGFWFALVPDDCNSDGAVNLYDSADFEFCLAGPDGEPPDPACVCFVQDGDKDVDMFDFAEFEMFFQTP